MQNPRVDQEGSAVSKPGRVSGERENTWRKEEEVRKRQRGAGESIEPREKVSGNASCT